MQREKYFSDHAGKILLPQSKFYTVGTILERLLQSSISEQGVLYVKCGSLRYPSDRNPGHIASHSARVFRRILFHLFVVYSLPPPPEDRSS